MQKHSPQSAEERIDEAIATCGESIFYGGSFLLGCCCWIFCISGARNYDSDNDL